MGLIHEYFDEQAMRSPEVIALYQDDRAITFDGLRIRVNRAAVGLESRGIREGCLVGLHVDRSIGWVVGLLAILKVNAAVVPLPPSYPVRRRQELATHGHLDCVIDEEATSLETTLPMRVFRLGELDASGGPTGAESIRGTPDQPAFVLSSSGSTGRPKMIVRSHGSFFHRLRWTWEQNPMSPGEVGCQKAHMTTTHAYYELLEPLLAGCPVVIVSDDEARNLERFWGIVRERAITRLLLVPSALRAALDMPDFQAPPLKVLILMGEAVDSRMADRLLAAFSAETQLFSIYGSTEASSTLVCDLRETVRPNGELPLGTPLTGDVKTFVLGSDLLPTQVGEVGRLYIGGSPLFAEYLNDSQLTESSFIRLEQDEGILFDTRDRVRLGDGGSLLFVGREDDFVKIRGFRVELSEVEHAMLAHPNVRQAAVLRRDPDVGEPTLVGFYSPSSISRAELFAHLRSHVPHYMVPSTLIGLGDLLSVRPV